MKSTVLKLVLLFVLMLIKISFEKYIWARHFISVKCIQSSVKYIIKYRKLLKKLWECRNKEVCMSNLLNMKNYIEILYYSGLFQTLIKILLASKTNKNRSNCYFKFDQAVNKLNKIFTGFYQLDLSHFLFRFKNI